MWKEPDIAYYPKQWLLFFPLGLIAVGAISFIVVMMWPLYLVFRLGRWTYLLFNEA